jgi:hypothetical protein
VKADRFAIATSNYSTAVRLRLVSQRTRYHIEIGEAVAHLEAE